MIGMPRPGNICAQSPVPLRKSPGGKFLKVAAAVYGMAVIAVPAPLAVADSPTIGSVCNDWDKLGYDASATTEVYCGLEPQKPGDARPETPSGLQEYWVPMVPFPLDSTKPVVAGSSCSGPVQVIGAVARRDCVE